MLQAQLTKQWVRSLSALLQTLCRKNSTEEEPCSCKETYGHKSAWASWRPLPTLGHLNSIIKPSWWSWVHKLPTAGTLESLGWKLSECSPMTNSHGLIHGVHVEAMMLRQVHLQYTTIKWMKQLLKMWSKANLWCCISEINGSSILVVKEAPFSLNGPFNSPKFEDVIGHIN